MATISYGNGGWIRVDEPTMPGQPIYVRYHSDDGRPVMTDFYIDGRGREIPSGLFRELDPTGFTAGAMRGKGSWLEIRQKLPGPDLSRLASYFDTSFYQAGGWVADSMIAQHNDIKGSGVKQVEMGPEPELVEPAAPEPVKLPTNGLTDDFLETVADNYAWAFTNRPRRRPAPMIAGQTGTSVRTVHAWIRKARDRGILAPTTRGKVG